MGFYIDKHFFYDTLYSSLGTTDNLETIKNAAVGKEEAGVTCYGQYNIIGLIKEKLGLAFKESVPIGDSKNGKEKVIIVDAKSYADWQLAEKNTREGRKKDLNNIFNEIAASRVKSHSEKNHKNKISNIINRKNLNTDTINEAIEKEVNLHNNFKKLREQAKRLEKTPHEQF